MDANFDNVLVQSNDLMWSADYTQDSFTALSNNIKEYNFQLPSSDYAIGLDGTVSAISLLSLEKTPLSLSALYEFFYPDQASVPVVASNRLELSQNGLKVISEKSEIVVFSNEGNTPTILRGKLSASHAIDKLFIFSKAGFEVDNLTLTGIKGLYLIAAGFKDLFNMREPYKVTHKLLKEVVSKEVIFDHTLEAINIKADIIGLQTSLITYAGWYKFGNELKLDNAEFFSKEAIEFTGKADITGVGRFVGKSFSAGDDFITSKELYIEVSEGVDSGATLRIFGNAGIHAQYLSLRMSDIEVNGALALILEQALNMQAGKIFAHILLVQNADGGRLTGNVEANSASISVDKGAIMKADKLLLKSASNVVKKVAKMFGSSNVIKNDSSAKGHPYYCGGAGSIYHDIFEGSLSSLLEVKENLALDIEYVQVHSSNLNVHGVLLLNNNSKDQEIKLDVQCDPLRIYAEDVRVYGNSGECTIWGPPYVTKVMQSAGFKNPPILKHGDSVTSSYSEVYDATPSVASAGMGILGQVHKTLIVCEKDTEIKMLEAVAGQGSNANKLLPNLNTITGANTNAIYSSALALAQTAFNLVAQLNPNREVKKEDMVTFTLQETRNFPFAEYIANDLPFLAGPDGGKDYEQYNYYLSKKYPSLYSCGADITTILRKLGVSPAQAGKIFCDADCQAELVKQASYKKLGVSLDVASAEIAAYVEQQRQNGEFYIKKRDCWVIEKLIENALKAKERFGLIVGGALYDDRLTK